MEFEQSEGDDVLEYDFEASVGCWVVSTAHAVKRALDAELTRNGITFRQWEILACLASRGELSQTELAERIGIEAPTLTSVLTRMERDGWLDRYGCPEDRRKKRLRPTAQAEAVWNRCVECCKRIRAAATEGIPEADLENLRVTCERIRDNLKLADSPLQAASHCG